MEIFKQCSINKISLCLGSSFYTDKSTIDELFIISIDVAAAYKHRMSRRIQAVNEWHNKKSKFIFDTLEQ